MKNDNDKASADSFVERNIPRLIKQLESGDNAMSFLAVYSFIEGYFRELFPYFNKPKKIVEGRIINYNFGDILEESSQNLELEKYGSEYMLYEELKLYHSSNNKKKILTRSSTNAIRHLFATINPGSLSVVVGQFIEFAEYRGFITDKISNMRRIAAVENSRKRRPLLPLNDSILYSQKNDLLVRYADISKYYEEKTSYISELKRIDAEMMDSKYENPEYAVYLAQLIKRKRKLARDIDNIDLKLEELSEYTDFIQELAISLIEARSRKNYENQIIHLSGDQKRLIKEGVDGLTEKEGHSMYIKGAPGTGKTLVLVVILFKLYFSRHDSVLLTYYPTLNKYIKYLFNLYNDDKLLNYFGLKKIDSNSLNYLANQGIRKFDEFLLPKIREVLGIKNTYSLIENTAILRDLCYKIEQNSRKADMLYSEIVENILPNMVDESKYCTKKQKNERWEKISQVLRALDDNNNMLDLYAYYKFCLSKINPIVFTNQSVDYILIDEAQDLTNAQIFAVNKFVKKEGGLILAGDPSQEIRNKRISMAQLDVNISGGKRYNPQLKQNYRNSKPIQNLGIDYRQEPCLHIRKNTELVDGYIAGPPPQIFITEDTEETNYTNTYAQIVNSVRMCTDDLCIVPENICIVAFNEAELMVIQRKLESELNIKSALIYKDFSFKNEIDVNDKVRLCTLREIKGIDCAVLLFMITDQSKQENNGGIISELKANAIYTCITRAMYLLQVFVPKYCRMSDLSIAVLVNKLCPNDLEVAKFVDEQNKKEIKGIPIKSYFEQYKNEPETEILKKIETALNQAYEQKFGSDENCYVQYSGDLMLAYVYALKKVVNIVQNELTEISLGDASFIDPKCTIDDEIKIYINPNELDIGIVNINKTESNSSVLENNKDVVPKNPNAATPSIDFDEDFINENSFKGTVRDSNIILVRKYFLTRADGKIVERPISDRITFMLYACINEDYMSKCEIGSKMKFRLNKLRVPKTINGDPVYFEICEPIIVLNEKSKSSKNSLQIQDRAGNKKLMQTVKKEWDPSLQDYIYTNKIKGPSPSKLDCINVLFNDAERPNIHSLEIWRDKNSLFSECTKGIKVRYKVIESETGYLQAIVLEILD